MNRVDKIAKFAQKKEEEIAREEKLRLDRIEAYKARIRELKPRIDELLGVGNACLKHKIPLTRFISNSLSHMVGFIGDKPLAEVGKVGCNSYDWNLTTDGTNFDIKGDAEYVLRLFLDGFNTFEKNFYAYVDEITA